MGILEANQVESCIEYMSKARHGFAMAQPRMNAKDVDEYRKAVEWFEYGQEHLERFYLEFEKTKPLFGPRGARKLAKVMGKTSQALEKLGDSILKSRNPSGATDLIMQARRLAEESTQIEEWARDLEGLQQREKAATTNEETAVSEEARRQAARERKEALQQSLNKTWKALGPVGQPIAIGVLVAIPIILFIAIIKMF